VPTKNEHRVCDAVARILEARVGTQRGNARCPEKDRIGPPVDYRFDLKGVPYAFEHTIVEAFPEQIRTGVDFDRFVSPIVDALDGSMPKPGVYYLNFSIDPSSGFKRKALPKLQQDVIYSVQQTAAALHAQAPVRRDRHHAPHGDNGSRELKIQGVMVALRREVHWQNRERHDGRLFVTRIAPEDYSTQRQVRLEDALKDKCPKLSDCKKEGAVSVLILENQDISLTNHVVVGEVLERLLAVERPDVPDEIFFVDTCISCQWTAWSVFRDKMFWPDEESSNRYSEFEPSELCDKLC
jgi:hypothetical protein